MYAAKEISGMRLKHSPGKRATKSLALLDTDRRLVDSVASSRIP